MQQNVHVWVLIAGVFNLAFAFFHLSKMLLALFVLGALLHGTAWQLARG